MIPDEDFARRSRRAHGRHKTMQLCRQVFRTLSISLSELTDPTLAEATIESVEPAGNSNCLRVTVSMARASIPAVYEALAKAQGRLRHEVATAITRKRAPELIFRVRPAKEVSDE